LSTINQQAFKHRTNHQAIKNLSRFRANFHTRFSSLRYHVRELQFVNLSRAINFATSLRDKKAIFVD
jgi:hypothetical protein